MIEVVAQFRPGIALREVARTDEVVVHGGGEVFRLPLTPEAVDRNRALTQSLAKLYDKLPVAVPRPRYVGVLPDGETPFTAERRLPGVAVSELSGIAQSQWEGVEAALAAISPREWAGLYGPSVLLADPGRGVLTGLVAWR